MSDQVHCLFPPSSSACSPISPSNRALTRRGRAGVAGAPPAGEGAAAAVREGRHEGRDGRQELMKKLQSRDHSGPLPPLPKDALYEARH
eukprot:3938590-Rhodomonas_salina.8